MSCQCMNLSTIIERNHEIDATEIDGEKVMMDIERGHYFMLNSVGSVIWDLIERPMSVQQLIEKLILEYEVVLEQCATEVQEFLHELHHANLVMIHE